MAALGTIIVAGCRLRYEELQVLGGGSTTGDGTALPHDPAGGTSGAPGSNGDGNAGSDDAAAGESATGGSESAGGSTGGAAGNDVGGTSGSAASGGATGSCVPDATCSCDVNQGHEYRLCAVLAHRDEGAAACQAANMVLVRVDSAEENAWLLQQFIDRGMFLGAGSPVVFLGGNDIAAEGTWRWDDGTVFWDGGPIDEFSTTGPVLPVRAAFQTAPACLPMALGRTVPATAAMRPSPVRVRSKAGWTERPPARQAEHAWAVKRHPRPAEQASQGAHRFGMSAAVPKAPCDGWR